MRNSLTQPAISGIRISDAWLTLIIGVILTGAAVIWEADNTGVKILAIIAFWLVSIVSVRMDITHPFFWFGGPFLIYSISGPVLFTLGMHPQVLWGGFPVSELNYSLAMDLQYWGLVASFLIIGPRRQDLFAALKDPRASQFFHGVIPILAVTLLISVFAISEIIAGGFTRKTDVVLYGSWATRFTFGLHMLATCVGVFLIKQFVEKKIARAYLAIGVFITIGFLVVLFAGERNFLFRVLIVIFFAYHIAHHRISPWSLLLLFSLTTPLIFILGHFKMGASIGLSWSVAQDIIDLTGFMETNSLMSDSSLVLYGKYMLFLILGDEFRAGGDNLAMLVTRMPTDIPYQNGVTILNDVASSLTPGFSRIKPVTSAYLYNSTIFPLNTARGGGQGFTLVGAGYMNFGVMGAILIMAAFGCAIRLVYRWAGKSAMGLFFFLGFLPLSFAAARNDLTMPVSQSLKHVLLPLAIMLITSYLMGREWKSGITGKPNS